MHYCVTYYQDQIQVTSYDDYLVATITAEALEDKGGMIVVSVEVNAVNDPEFEKEKSWLETKWNSFKNNFKNKIETWGNIWNRYHKADEAVKEVSQSRGVSTGWSIGKLFKGRFFDNDTGKIYNEDSFSIDIRGVPYEFVQEVAEKVAKEFNQKSVLVLNHETNRIEFLP